jgi:hypothetical protein
MKIAAIAAIARTPAPVPIPIPIFSPVFKDEVSPVLEVELVGATEFDPEGGIVGVASEVPAGWLLVVYEDDEVLAGWLLVVLVVLEIEIPIVAARITRLFMAQHCSEVNPAPQHQLPSVEHCDSTLLSLAVPPSCLHQPTALPAYSFSTYRRVRTNSFQAKRTGPG